MRPNSFAHVTKATQRARRRGCHGHLGQRGAVALLGKGNRMNKRQAKIDALSASAVVLFGLADSDFGDELCDENREKLLRAVNNIAQRLWERSMKLKERNG